MSTTTEKDPHEIIKETEHDSNIKNCIFKGLNILARYDEDIYISAEHDVIYACDFDTTADEMTDEEIREMAKMVWFEDEDSWTHYT